MKIKLNTTIIIAKGFCYVLIGVFTPWSAALAQWVNSGDWPSKIIWVAVILPASAIGGATQLLSFLSGSFTEYKQQKRADDTQRTQIVTTVPTAPTVTTEEPTKP